MKLQSDTIDILKNFSGIYESLRIKPGNKLVTKTPGNNMLAVAITKDHFPKDAALYEINKFLGVLSLMQEPELDFQDTKVVVTSNGHTINYGYCPPDQVKAPDRDELKGDYPIEFAITADALQKIVRATSILKLTAIAIVGNGETLTLEALHDKNPIADTYRIEVGPVENTFKYVIDLDLISKLLSRDYMVAVSTAGFVRFQASDVTYWIAANRNASSKGDL